jgi:hypothetical protein
MFKLLLLSLSLSFLTSCASIFTPSNPEAWMESKKNACLPTAIAFREGLRKYNVWAEVLIYQFDYTNTKKKKSSGHAIVAYMYPCGQNKLWTYDHWGSYRVRAYIDDPLDIAKKAVKARQEDRHVTSAHFHK